MISRYDEKTYAEIIEQNGFQTNKIRYELELLVKLWSNNGDSKEVIEDKLVEFCTKYYYRFSQNRDYLIIDNTIRKAFGKDLVYVPFVNITKKEMKVIDELNLDDTKSKILLSFIFKIKLIRLLLNKEDDKVWYFNGDYKKYNEIKKISKISSRQNIHKHIHEMSEKNIIKPMLNGTILLTFMENCDNIDSKEVLYTLTITSYSEVGLLWDKYKDNIKIINCSHCGKLMKANNNKHKYCKDCAVVVNREKSKTRKLKSLI